MTIKALKIGLVGLALFAILPAHAADVLKDRVTASNQNGYSRLSFTFAPAGHVTAASDGSVLTLAFDRKPAFDAQMVAGLMGGAVSGVHADADGKTFRFALTRPIKLHQSTVGARAVVDVAPQDFTGVMPDLPPPRPPAAPKAPDIASLPMLALRVGSYTNFTRLVFDWRRNVPYTVFRGAGKLTIRFEGLARPDLSAITRFAPPWVKNAAWRIDGKATVVEFETDVDSRYHDFKSGTKIVLDILAPKTDASAYAPPGVARPGTTRLAAGVSQAQAAAIAAAAGRTADKTPAAKSAAAQPPAPATKSPAASPPAPASPDTPPTQAAESRLTRNGAIVSFKGAGAQPAAVFVRGLTAWIVLEGAPAFDVAALKAALGDVAAGLDASSAPGLSILRLTLKQPEPIAALTHGTDLEVVIGGAGGVTPVGIGFSRDQNDPARAALTAFLPRADKSFTLLDPVAGDTLTVIPGGGGYAMLKKRVYAQFAALPTAEGLVLTAYADDLQVAVAKAGVRISRPGGLSLTPPLTAMGDTPSALARDSGGPSYLDFAAWGRQSAGSFLATERQLLQAVARHNPADANPARLALARFYLANHFAAEALGLIKLIQTADPALVGDTQLTVMRAAADYMMGRDRDAHNDLAATAFDSDPHAALWRGLTEAAQENWNAAHNDLAVAAPVLKRYPAAWQAHAHLADAEAALGIGRPELADAALKRLPRNISGADALEAKLVKARMAAAGGSYYEAAPLFAAVEKGGDERLAARAIYYQTDAALKAGAITPKQGIDALERLRFRWRGDGLEMKTLRRLAGLYFAAHKWREGLKTLRVATQNFQDDDAARSAQDDMRAAFVNLFLKGAADKMPPVESLSLFYDNIDLTPIGADGDEMIRRMADRLVAVDLLGPAARLLAYQVDKRLDGIAKAQVATRLAAIYLMDRKPQQAIDVLHTSQITGLSDAAIHDRLLLEARGFAALKQWDNALDLIAVDDAPDTRQLRADIYWESGNWEAAGQSTEALLGNRFADAAPLAGTERAQVLRMAVAYSLANDETSLERLRRNYAPKMTGTPDAGIFTVLSQDIAMHGLAFRDAARQIASVDTLEAFMKDFSKRREMVATN